MKMTLPQFQKEPFLPTPKNFQSQTQGSLCDFSNCQNHVGAAGRALPISLGLLKHFLACILITILAFREGPIYPKVEMKIPCTYFS